MSQLKPGMLAGKRYKEMFEVEIDGEKFEVEIQALKQTQIARVQQIQLAGLKGRADQSINTFEVDLGDSIVNNAAAFLEAAAAGMVGEGWTKEVIEEELPADAITKIGARVLVISGIGAAEEVKRFREEKSKVN